MPKTSSAERTPASVVRRLAVAEACRLMGFPDDYLDIDGTDTPDAPRSADASLIPC